MRLVLKSKTTGRVIHEFTGNYHYQVYLGLENFLDGLLVSPDFVDSRAYLLVVYKK